MSSDFQEKMCNHVRSFLSEQRLDFSESVEQYATRFDVRYGKDTCITKVTNKGTIYNQGANTKLKELMENFKNAIENGEMLPASLPFEIESFPERLQSGIPSIDPIIVYFINEAIICLKANSVAGGAFLLGAASEKAILLLIDAYANAIADVTNQTNFLSRVNNRFISRAFDEFRRSYQSCKSKPTDPALTQDLDVKVETIFHFCRICRNEVGHPEIIPNLDKGIIIANMAQFVKYVEVIYGLIKYFNETPVVL